LLTLTHTVIGIPKAFPHFHINNNLTEKEKKRRSLTNKSIKDTNKEYKKKKTMTAIILVLDLLHAGGDTLVYQHLRRNVPPPLNTPDLTKTNNIINNKKKLNICTEFAACCGRFSVTTLAQKCATAAENARLDNK